MFFIPSIITSYYHRKNALKEASSQWLLSHRFYIGEGLHNSRWNMLFWSSHVYGKNGFLHSNILQRFRQLSCLIYPLLWGVYIEIKNKRAWDGLNQSLCGKGMNVKIFRCPQEVSAGIHRKTIKFYSIIMFPWLRNEGCHLSLHI